MNEIFYCIYYPNRDKYTAYNSLKREAVQGIAAFRTKRAINACIKVLEKGQVKCMTKEAIIEECKARKVGCIVILDNPLVPEFIYF